MSETETKKCKAIIQDGPRKGQPCIPVTAIDSDGYCKRHQRQKEYDILVGQGKHLCRKFFRGCNSEVQEGEKTCKICLGNPKKVVCSHIVDGVQCTFEVLHSNTKYCGKHQRDSYKDYEKENNISICNIERGCMNVCNPGFLSCDSCIINNYITNDRYYSEYILNINNCIICETSYTSSTLCDALKRCESCCNDFMTSHIGKKILQLRAYRNMPIESYYNTYVKGAYTRSKEIDFQLSLSEFITLIKQPCYYCNSTTDNDFMGIDRVDNNGNYSAENCVPCCTTCNRMKYSYSIGEFVNKCIAIHTYLLTGVSITNKLWTVYPTFKTLSTLYYSDYKDRCVGEKNRNIKFMLGKDEFNHIKTKPCYLCGVENTDEHYNGIDRINNSKEYTTENCKPCCGHCNFMKGPIPIGILKYHIAKIATNQHLQQYIHTIEETKIDDTISNYTETDSSDIDSIEECENRFTTKQIFEMFDSTFDKIIHYCTIHNRSNTFIRKVQNLYETQSEYTKDEIQMKLVRFVNAEHEKKRTETTDSQKKHMKTNDVLTMLESGKLDDYIEWHTANIGPESSLFRKELEALVRRLPILTANEKVVECKNILKKEHNRRNYARASEKVKAKLPTLQTTHKDSKPKMTKEFQVVDVNTLMPSKPNVIQHVPNDIPKQWKTRDIYEYMKTDQEQYYKQYCEEHNVISEPAWSTMWSTFITHVKGQPWDVAEPRIREFVEELRKCRHLALCERKRNVIDREDRKIWPAETVAKLFLEGRIQEFKHYTEEMTGDTDEDPKWKKRWSEFVGDLQTNENDTAVLTKLISKFMTAQRTKKYRRQK